LDRLRFEDIARPPFAGDNGHLAVVGIDFDSSVFAHSWLLFFGSLQSTLRFKASNESAAKE